MKKPLFSIITVTLNPGEDLACTINSVLGQSFEDYEILIKDGGSHDGTEKLSWKDTRVSRITKPDNGIFDAMNQALALVSGKWVLFLNAGDHLYDAQTLRDVAAFIRESKDIPFFFGDIRKTTGRSGFCIYPNKLSRYFLFNHIICHQAWFLDRNLYLKYGGFETRCTAGGDHRLYLRMLARDNIPYRHISRLVVNYKGGGVSTHHSVIQQSREWRQSLKREIFSTSEYIVFSSIWLLRNILKRIIYDTLGWCLVRQQLKHRFKPE